jgi:hypothetical protein
LILLTINAVANAKASPVGCYSVFVAEANASPVHLASPEHLVRAKDIRLTSKHATTPWAGGAVFQVLPAASSDKFAYSASYWQVKKDGLSIIWSNTGLAGVEMTLTPTRSGFEGSIENFWDFEPFTTDKRRAVLTRKPC